MGDSCRRVEEKLGQPAFRCSRGQLASESLMPLRLLETVQMERDREECGSSTGFAKDE